VPVYRTVLTRQLAHRYALPLALGRPSPSRAIRAREPVRAQAVAAGADAFIDKAASIREIVATIARVA